MSSVLRKIAPAERRNNGRIDSKSADDKTC